MSPSPAYRFLDVVRAVAAAARAEGLAVPTFRSPPRVPDALRTIRYRPGGATVSVATRGRPSWAVLGDCVEGVIAANGLRGGDAVRARTALLGALADHPAVADEARAA